MNQEFEQYCPVCGRTITTDNVQEFISGDHDGLLFVHDAIPHDDLDIAALRSGIQ